MKKTTWEREAEDNDVLPLIIDGVKTGVLELPHMWKVEALNAGIRCGENLGAPISEAY